jgi:hypothetical protein
LPILEDPRYERFSQLLSKGMPQSQAYVDSGFQAATDQSIRVGACKLAKKAIIVKRVAELQDAGSRRAEREVGVTKGRVLQMLIDDRDGARERGQYNAAIRADELLGKTLGIFTEKIEVRGGPLDDINFEDLEALIEAVNAETARRASNAGESADADSPELAWLPPRS